MYLHYPRLMFMVLFFVATSLYVPDIHVAQAATSSITTDATLHQGLVSYWTMDEEGGTRNDSVGLNNLFPGNSPTGGTGIYAGATKMDSENNDFMYLDGDLSVRFGKDFAISMWVKLNSEPSTNIIRQLFVKWTRSINGQLISLDYEDYQNSKYIHYVVDTNPYVAEGWIPVQEFGDEWHHVVMSVNFQNPQVNLFLDGSRIAQSSNINQFGGGAGSYNSFFVLGQSRDGSNTYGRYLDGLVDEVGLWNRALSDEEVTRLYNDGVGIPYELDDAPASATTSVAFFPGIMASRLYKPNDGGVGEVQLWESLLAANVYDIDMRDDGTSVRSDIYTRDVIDYAIKLTGSWHLGGESYAGFIEYLNDLKAEQVIHDWAAIPYDWRLTLEALRTQGAQDAYGRISYLNSTSTPYIYQELNRLADASPSGKVTIVAHSNGGIVVKHLLKALQEANDPLYEKIEAVILVGSPQLGTPKAIGELLHGTIPVVQNAVREVSERMPGAYQLIPSREYFAHTTDPLVVFESTVAQVPTYASLAGTSITSYEGMRTFLEGSNGLWQEPTVFDSATPNVLDSALLSAADATHSSLDTWEPDDHIRMVQIIATGIDTPRQVRYYDFCTKVWRGSTTCNPTLYHEYGFSRRGDGTVMGGSARGSNVQTSYYVELNEHNRDEKLNRRHADMLSAEPIQTLIRQELTHNTGILPEYVTEEEQATDAQLRYRFRVYSPVDIHVYNATGEHTGVTEKQGGELGRTFEEEVSNSYYLEWGEVKYAGVDGEQGPVRLVLDGSDVGTFRLEVDLVEGDEVVDTLVFGPLPVTPHASGTIQLKKGVPPTLAYDVDGDGVVDSVVAADAPMAQMTRLYLTAYKYAVKDGVLDASLKKWLLGRLEVVEKLISKRGVGNLTAAHAILETISRTIERETPRTIPRAVSASLLSLLAPLLSGMQ